MWKTQEFWAGVFWTSFLAWATCTVLFFYELAK